MITTGKLLHEFVRTGSGFKAQVWQKDDKSYAVVGYHGDGIESLRGFVNLEHAIDYALSCIMPYRF